MENVVDARGLSCPLPVIQARQAVKAGVFPVEVLVDTRTSCENVRRALEMMGHRVEIQEQGDEFRLTITA